MSTSSLAFGWCLAHNEDVPVDGNRLCLEHHRITIPPSGGSASQTWVDGAWVPDKPRPEPSACGKPTRRARSSSCARS